MSRSAQAERESQAGVILGESEEQIAPRYQVASVVYAGDRTALHLRAMIILFEGLQRKGVVIIVPCSAVESVNLSGIMGMTSHQQGPAKPAHGNGDLAPESPEKFS